MTILAWERKVAHKREIFQNYTVSSANENRSSISEQLSHIAEIEKEVDIDFILNDGYQRKAGQPINSIR